MHDLCLCVRNNKHGHGTNIWGYVSNKFNFNKNYCFPGSDVMCSGRCLPTFLRNISTLIPQNSSTLMKEEAGYSEMIVTIYQMIQLRAFLHLSRQLTVTSAAGCKVSYVCSTWSNFRSCRDRFVVTEANSEFPLSQKSESPSRDIRITLLLHQITFLNRFKDKKR